MKHFKNPQEALAYVMPELIATLQDDLERMCCEEWDQYEESDRAEMRSKIADLEAIQDDVVLLSELKVNAVWGRRNFEAGSFGNLYDPNEVLTIVDGWGDEYEFDASNAEDRAAVTAWCEAEGASIEDDISKLVCDQLPTREIAFAALAKKRENDQ